MKKILVLFTLIFSLGLLNITTSYASSLPIYDETYNNNQGAIYANGTPIIVSEENGKTVVSWENGSQIVPNSVTIFGGGNGGNFASSSITMNVGNKIKTVNVEIKNFGLLIIAGIAMLILYVIILFLIFGAYVPIG